MAVLQGIFAKYGLLHKTARKLRSHFKSLCANSLEKLAGNFFDLAGKQQGMLSNQASWFGLSTQVDGSQVRSLCKPRVLGTTRSRADPWPRSGAADRAGTPAPLPS